MTNIIDTVKKSRSAEFRWECEQELERIIPSVQPFSVSGSIDRYGFTHVLAALCGLKNPKRPFAEWIHGWIWDEQPTAESLAVDKLNRTVPVVVRNNLEYECLKSAGFREIHIGGLPFCYVGKQHNSKNKHALLAIPPHSAEVERLNSSQIEYMNFLETLKSDFDGVYVSIFYLDWGGALHQAARARGLNIILGARPDDANSLIRTRSLFDAFDFVTSNIMGSHFVYALHANCKFSFSGPIYQYDEQTFLGNGNPNNHSLAKVERFLNIQSERYLRSRFDLFFTDHPSSGSCNMELGRSEIGVDNVLNKEQIREVVGWTIPGQMHGYLRGGLNRAQRILGRHDD